MDPDRFLDHVCHQSAGIAGLQIGQGIGFLLRPKLQSLGISKLDVRVRSSGKSIPYNPGRVFEASCMDHVWTRSLKPAQPLAQECLASNPVNPDPSVAQSLLRPGKAKGLNSLPGNFSYLQGYALFLHCEDSVQPVLLPRAPRL